MTEIQAPIAVILGPTACGKTELSLDVAEQLGAEIISGDSMQVYRGMDIGTAKLPPEERRGIPHHLIDVVEPDFSFNVADFQAAALEKAAEITERGHLPLLVGGTGLYLSALFGDYSFAPDSNPDPALRQRLLEQWLPDQGETLHQRLADIDPAAAQRIHAHDQRRLFRALEVYETTGHTITSQQQTPMKKTAFQPIQIGLTRERESLYQRIDLRVEQMMEQGFLAEVQGLLTAGLSRDAVSMQGLGYRQLAAYLAGETDLSTAVALIQRDTRRFAKRQWTWFRRDTATRWFAIEGYREEGALAQAVCQYLTDRLKGESS